MRTTGPLTAFVLMAACGSEDPFGATPPGELLHHSITSFAGTTSATALAAAVQADGKVVIAGYAHLGATGGVGEDWLVARLDTAGALDPSFGDGGLVHIDFLFSNERPASVAIAADGDIVVVGKTLDDFAVARLRPDGSLADFGSGGRVTVTFDEPDRFGSGSRDFCIGVHAQDDGDLLLIGGADVSYQDAIGLARLHADGSVDATFGRHGRVATTFGGQWLYLLTSAVQADGRILVGGGRHEPFADDWMTLTRFLPNGELDPGFGTNGEVLLVGMPFIRDLGVQSTGRILASVPGAAQGDLWAFLPDGTLDPAFDGDGMMSAGGGNLFVLPDDSFYVLGTNIRRFHPDGTADSSFGDPLLVTSGPTAVGSGGDLFVAARVVEEDEPAAIGVRHFTSDGAADLAFGRDGVGMITAPFGHDEVRALVPLSGGRLLAAGTARNLSGTQPDIALVQYTASRERDETFGDGGRATLDIDSGSTDLVEDAVTTRDGRFLIAGTYSRDFALTRFLPSGHPDPAFGVDGRAVFDHQAGLDLAFAVRLLPDGRALAAGTSNGDFAVARVTPSGVLDTTFGRAGWAVIDLNNDDIAHAMLLLDDGSMVLAGHSGNAVALAGLDADGALDPSFGDGGVTRTEITAGETTAHAIGRAFDGRITVAGSVFNGYDDDALFIRYTANGWLDPAFGVGGVVTIDLDAGDQRAFALSVSALGAVTAAGTHTDILTTTAALFRLDANGVPTDGWGVNGVHVLDWLRDGPQATYAFARGADGELILGGTANGDFLVTWFVP